MILYLAPGGRLGNQLFQATFIEKIRKPKEFIFCTQMSEVLRFTYGLSRYINTDNLIFIKFIEYIVAPFFSKFIIPLGLISFYGENNKGDIIYQKGLLPITYVRGYFQQADAIKAKPPFNFRKRRAIVVEAVKLLQQAENRVPLFVHVRRGDYLGFEEHDTDNPLLPLSFYQKAIKTIMDSIPNGHFFFLGDDPVWCSNNFPEIAHKTIVHFSEALDFTVMTLCAGGIISNSTFAWWAAFFSLRNAPIIAPRYWLGWRTEIWRPTRIQSDFLTYINV